MKPSDWVTLVIEQGQALRRVGVTSLAIDGFAVELSPLPPGQVGADDREAPIESPDPLHRAETYASGVVPGFDLSHLNDEDVIQ